MFQVFNDSGTLMIDANYYNHAAVVINQGVTSNPGNLEIRAYWLDITYQSNNPTGYLPLVGFKCSVPVSLLWIKKNGNSYSIRLITASAATITYYIFDKPVGGGNSGLQILDANQQVVFDSNYRYLKILNTVRRVGVDNSPVAVADSNNSIIVVTAPQFSMQTDILAPVPGGVWRSQSHLEARSFLLTNNQLQIGTITYNIHIVPGNTTSPPGGSLPDNSSKRWDVFVASSLGF